MCAVCMVQCPRLRSLVSLCLSLSLCIIISVSFSPFRSPHGPRGCAEGKWCLMAAGSGSTSPLLLRLGRLRAGGRVDARVRERVAGLVWVREGKKRCAAQRGRTRIRTRRAGVSSARSPPARRRVL
ncbi:hypothetical protein C8Q79DRAFT_211642 [Trametes meyenii]|nr:hypothetical protein C8Q79DRAFT_211642 [Trametes meyenii]